MLNVYRKLVLDGKHARYAYNHASVSLKFKISDLTLLNLTFNLTKPSPPIPLIHSFHRSFFHSDSYPGCFDVRGQKDMLKEQLYLVNIG